MPDVEQIPSLIGDIYDAALDPSRWTSVLQKTRDVVGGSAAAVFSNDARTRNLNVYSHSGGIDPRYQLLYTEKCEKLDPSTTAHVPGQTEETISTADFMALDDLQETRFYEEWGRPQGLVDFAAAVLDRTATGAILFGV